MEDKIENIVKNAITEKTFPGCVIGIIKDGKDFILPFGNQTYDLGSPKVEKDTIYDVASVTKSIPLSSIALKLLDQKKISLDDKVYQFLDDFSGDGKEEVTLKHLLTYTLDLDLPSLSNFSDKSAPELLNIILKAPLKNKPGEKFIYNNSTAIILGLVIEIATGKKILELADEYFFKPLEMNRTTFFPQEFSLNEIAPTESIHGEVHDESARILFKEDRVLGASGLFSTVPDLLNFMRELMIDKKLFGDEILKQIWTNQTPNLSTGSTLLTTSRTGLGWELFGEDLAGERRSPNTFGKTGFTGTMVLGDPIKKVCLVFLSNRIYPKRPQNSEKINKIRRDISDIVLN